MLDPHIAQTTQQQNPVVNVNADGSVTVTQRDGTSWFARGYVYLPPGTYDFYSQFGSDYASRYIVNDVNAETSWKNKKTVTVTEMTKFRFKAAMGTDYPVTGWLQIFNSGDAYGEYPYKGVVHNITFPSTMYGGYINPTTGELVATWYKYAFTGEEPISEYSGTYRSYNLLAAYPPDPTTKTNAMCTHASYNGYASQTQTRFSMTDGGTVYFRPAFTVLYPTVEEFIAFLKAEYAAGHPVEVVYPLATPITYSLTGVNITTLRHQNNIWCNTNGITEVDYLDRSGPMSTYRRNIIMNSPHDMEGSGWMAKFTTDMRAPLKSMRCYFNPVQDAGVPSPDNVLPISGWSGLTVGHGTKNLLDPSLIIAEANMEKSGDVFQNTNVDTRNNLQLCVQLWKSRYSYIKTAYTLNNVPTGRVSFSFQVDDRQCNYLCFKHNGTTRDFRLLFPFGLPVGTYVISVDVLANDPTTIGGVKLMNIQIEQGDTASAYESFNGSTSQVVFPSTLYGGWCDPMAGVGEATYGYADLGTKTWTIDDATVYPGMARTNRLNVPNMKFLGTVYCTHYKGVHETIYSGLFKFGEISITNSQENPILRIKDQSFIGKTAEEVKSMLSGVYIAYELENPTPFTFTPISQLKASRNQNNIWHSANGQTECRFWAHKGTDDSTLLTNSDGAYIVTSDGMYVLVG